MSQKPKLITCNYTNLYQTRLNGRLNRDQIYMYSLRAIAECGEPILCYTGQYNMNFVTPYLESCGVTNIIQINYDLTSSPYHTRVEAIKDLNDFYYKDNSWGNRCVEIMWGKFLWLEQNFQSLDDDDYLYWTDAGLSHGGIMPRLFNPFHNNPQYYNPEKPEDMLLEYAHRHDKVYNKDFIRKLQTYTGDKILTIASTHNQHNDSLGFEYENTQHLWPIGGLFGGKKKVMIPFINRFKEIAEMVLAKNLLVKEEQIMTVILNESPDWFKVFPFETWYHPDWVGVYNTSMRSFYNFFEEILNVP